jgi:hypothetical protein
LYHACSHGQEFLGGIGHRAGSETVSTSQVEQELGAQGNRLAGHPGPRSSHQRRRPSRVAETDEIQRARAAGTTRPARDGDNHEPTERGGNRD